MIVRKMQEHLKDIQEYWEVISKSDLDQDFKDHWIDENGDPLNEKLFKEIAEYIINFNSSSKTILEVGCGTGRILKNIQNKDKNINLFGIDISQNQINLCKENVLDCVLHAGDLESFIKEYPLSNFDLIFLHSVTQYFPSQEYFECFLDQAYSQLNIGGSLLLIDVPNSWYIDLVDEKKITTIRLIKLLIKKLIPKFIFKNYKKNKRTIYEILNNKKFKVPYFMGFYPDPLFVLEFSKNKFKNVQMTYQCFESKPLFYKKFRPIFLLEGKI